jgi:hypothetical protein
MRDLTRRVAQLEDQAATQRGRRIVVVWPESCKHSKESIGTETVGQSGASDTVIIRVSYADVAQTAWPTGPAPDL